MEGYLMPIVLPQPLNLCRKDQDRPESTSSYCTQCDPCSHPRKFCDNEKVVRNPWFEAYRDCSSADCMEEIGDAIDELQQSLDELGHVGRGSNFWFQMSDIQTWVSAALTDEDTCMDGFEEHHLRGRVEAVVRRYTVNVAHLTSNALALINSYASSKAALP
ncbi:unnamed protein product [Prunus armeniaca]|uniref:Pectinesterase inhibitor domain-containing protein n=1 Tax=Prunus armeniaca TaxID=36596 RepID=A0A6J5XB30_PRUAR|nr:unnamed protein product [Prunus armeniaca]